MFNVMNRDQLRIQTRQTRINLIQTHTMTTRKRPRNSPDTNQRKNSKRSKLLEDKINKAIRASLKESAGKDSRTKYKSNIKQYFNFCADNKIPIEEVSPAKEDILCYFASSFKGKMSGKTVRRKIGSIKTWHIREKKPWYGGEKLTRVLKGIDKATPASSIKEARPGVKPKWLEYLATDLNPKLGLHAAVKGAADSSVFSQLRLGEILPSTKSIKKYNFNWLPAVKHFRYSPENDTTLLRLPRTKTELHGTDVVIPKQKGSINPIESIRNHIRTNKLAPEDPLFAYRNQKGELVALTKAEFLKTCNSIWKKKGIQRITGHSFRIGGTTYYLLQGVNPDVVKKLGRWKSDAFLRYWRSLDKLAVIHIENIHGTSWKRQMRGKGTRTVGKRLRRTLA